MPLKSSKKLELIKKYVPEIINANDHVWYIDENKESRYTYKGYRWGCEKLIALIHFNVPLNAIIEDRAFGEYVSDERKWHSIGIEQLEFFDSAVFITGNEYIFDKSFSFAKHMDYCIFCKEYMKNPLEPESKSLNGLKDLIYGFSHYSLLKNVMNADNNSALVAEVSNDKRQRNLTLQLAPKYNIKSEEGSYISVSVLWDRPICAGDTYIVTKGFDGCLFLFSEPEFNKFEKMLQTMVDKGPEQRMLVRFFLASASRVKLLPDNQMRLPQALIDFAKLGAEGVIEGKGEFAKLWNRTDWEAVHFVGFDDVLRRLKPQRRNDELQKRSEEIISKYVQMVSIISREFLRELKRQMIDEIADLYNLSISFSFKEEIINKAYICDSTIIKNEPIELELMGREFIERIVAGDF